MRAFPAASCTDRCSVAATFSSSKITGLCSFARFSCLQFLLENLHQFFDVPDPSCARLSCHLPFAKIAACRQAARYFEKFFHVSADDLLWFSEPSFKNLYCRNVVIVGQLQTLDSTRSDFRLLNLSISEIAVFECIEDIVRIPKGIPVGDVSFAGLWQCQFWEFRFRFSAAPWVLSGALSARLQDCSWSLVVVSIRLFVLCTAKFQWLLEQCRILLFPCPTFRDRKVPERPCQCHLSSLAFLQVVGRLLRVV